MDRQHLLIVAGMPGAGKSTLVRRVVDRWGALSFESDIFLGESGRAPSGDFTDDALARVYPAMSEAAAAALATKRLVLASGSFRAANQRALFREVAKKAGTTATTLRIDAPVDKAAERVRARITQGGQGPTIDVILRIEEELAQAADIDVVIVNNGTIEELHQAIDALMESMVWTIDHRTGAPMAFVERFEGLAETELAHAREMVEPERLRTWPVDRVSAILRSVLPASVQASVIPNTPQRCRIEVKSSQIGKAGKALRESGLRTVQDQDGLTVFIPVLAPSVRNEIVDAIEQELQRARDRVRELRNFMLLALPRPFNSTIEAALQKATDKWINAVDRLGSVVLSEISE